MLTRTPCSTSSARSASARARRPNFEAAYADHSALAIRPAEELTKTTVPRVARTCGQELTGQHRGGGEVDRELLLPVREAQPADRAEVDDAGHVQDRVERAVDLAAERR